MSRKDYEAFAAVFRSTFPRNNKSAKEWNVIARLMRDTASIFAADNPRFNRKRFYNACTPNDGV